ncbi:hypothetical protein CH373_00665 [Leptospira perolatii]|uniref:Uncharacterized protein n=1 Tax=Leptospira perolatii TaxID=2023191 RepID=A0A2M9ZRL4_9LEPT|nr:hypothetical protein CH360_00665 [Leptospira perolatii]PJZ74601.1 hypothetical protein CH373_00665 [Leptospira perolatii]
MEFSPSENSKLGLAKNFCQEDSQNGSIPNPGYTRYVLELMVRKFGNFMDGRSLTNGGQMTFIL